ncbi:unnamed protein product [Psylliodes chrysocephalus]|uniref:ABC-2 type transporter transmembrane domain-containing protein n=1 Tax=Psylliodes chrysocephalus TaxID=3402493 RepID=A0A9P0CIN6_9CUCU|nr:unnamed protein product [Psylliodes chrysocephala]
MWKRIGIILIFTLSTIHFKQFCLATEDESNELKLAIVNHETNYTNLTYQECDWKPGCKLKQLSCRYLDEFMNHINITITEEYYRTPEEAKDAVRTNKVVGALYFTENFTDALVARLLLGNMSDDNTINQSEVRVWLDTSNQPVGETLPTDLHVAFQNFTKDIHSDCNIREELLEIPLSLMNLD